MKRSTKKVNENVMGMGMLKHNNINSAFVWEKEVVEGKEKEVQEGEEEEDQKRKKAKEKKGKEEEEERKYDKKFLKVKMTKERKMNRKRTAKRKRTRNNKNQKKNQEERKFIGVDERRNGKSEKRAVEKM